MSIRDARVTDAPQVRSVADASWHAAHGPIIGTAAVDTVLDQWYDVDDIEASIDAENAPMFVGVEDGDVIGFAQGRASDEPFADAVLSRIYVHPAYWGEGVGSRLFERLMRRLDAEGHTDVWLSVLAENDIGRRFYEKHGFEAYERRHTELADQRVEELILRRSL